MGLSKTVCLILGKRIWILISLFILTIHVCNSLVCLSHEHNLDQRQCCRKCAPGSGVTLPCSYLNNTRCEPCIHGVSFSGQHSHIEMCRSCLKCVENAHYIRQCNITHNAICQCNEDFYFDARDNNCKFCSLCPPGWGASRPCIATHNTICRKCPNGTYSDVLDGSSGCRVCTKCKRHQRKLQACSSFQDTLCMDTGDVYSKPTPISSIKSFAGQEPSGPAGADFIPLYCAVLAIVVIALLVYVIIQHRKKGFGSRELKDETEALRRGSDCVMYVDSEGKPIRMSTRLRDLPPIKKKEIEVTLQKKVAGRSSWTVLARELGFNKNKISAIERQAEQEHVSSSKCLLHEWSKSDNATIGVLIRGLRCIGRIDIVKMLHGEASVMVYNRKCEYNRTKNKSATSSIAQV